MAEKWRIVYEYDGREMTISDGAGGATTMPRRAMAMIAATAVEATLAGKPCDCADCRLLRMAAQMLSGRGKMRKVVGDAPFAVSREKLC
jgi:hypothetical protein